MPFHDSRPLLVRTILTLAPIVLTPAILHADSIRFAVLGDSRGKTHEEPVNTQVLSELVADVLAADPPVRFVVFPGDLVHGSDFDKILATQLDVWRKIAAPWYAADFLGAKVYPVPGNHDLPNRDALPVWPRVFPELPDNGPPGDKKMTYSFDAGPVHLALVNQYSYLGKHRVNLDWLADDLAASKAPVKLVFGHDPAFPFQSHIGASLDHVPVARDRFWRILVENGVRAYFCAHEHIYNHSIKDGVHQIISGGAGAPGKFFHYLILDVDGTNVTVSVHKADRTLHERYTLAQSANVPSPNPTSRLRYLIAPTTRPGLFWGTIAAIAAAIAVLAILRHRRRTRSSGVTDRGRPSHD